MKFNITAFIVLVLAIVLGQFISNKFFSPNPVENEVKKKVSNSGNAVQDFLDNYE